MQSARRVAQADQAVAGADLALSAPTETRPRGGAAKDLVRISAIVDVCFRLIVDGELLAPIEI